MAGGKQEGPGQREPAFSAERILRSSGWDRLFSGAGLLLVLLFGLFAARGWLPGRDEAGKPVGPDTVLLMEPVALGETPAERLWAAALVEALSRHLQQVTEVIRAEDSPSASTTYIPHLAGEAGAGAALTATVFQVEGGIRIQVRLIPAGRSTRRWRERYDLPWPGSVDQQADALAGEIVAALYGPGSG